MTLLSNLPHKCRIQRRIREYSGEFGATRDSHEVIQINVECWEQTLSANTIDEYQKRGINVTNRVYFASDPNVQEEYEIVITERNGTAVSVANQRALDVKAAYDPDASAGLGVLYKVLVFENKGASR